MPNEGGSMKVAAKRIYEQGIVKLNTKIEAPESSKVLVVFKTRGNKANFLKSADSKKYIVTGIFKCISS